MSNINDLFPTGKIVKVGGLDLVITPFKFGQLPRVFKAVNPIFANITKILTDSVNQYEGIASLLMTNGEDVLQLMMVGANKPREFFDTIELDEGVDLLTAILEVNGSFFVQKVLPKLNEALEGMNKLGGNQSS